MKTFAVTTNHEIIEDNYEEGETEPVNHFKLESIHTTDSLLMALRGHYMQHGYTFDEDRVELDEFNKSRMIDSIQVDVDNTEPSEYQVAQWKEGKIKLYADNIDCYVHELVLLNLEDFKAGTVIKF